MINGLLVTPLKRICHEKGDIRHAMKCSDVGYDGFGEAYFSSIQKGDIKGWKMHQQMTMNLIVPFGAIKFVVLDACGIEGKQAFKELTLGEENYARLTVPPGLWVAFQGVGSGDNCLLNVASIEHDPEESISKGLEAFPYEW